MDETSNDVMWALIGTVATSLIAGIAWLCTKKCRNQECQIDSGCCKFHSDSKLRATIREEIQKEKESSSSISP